MRYQEDEEANACKGMSKIIVEPCAIQGRSEFLIDTGTKTKEEPIIDIVHCIGRKPVGTVSIHYTNGGTKAIERAGVITRRERKMIF